MERAFEPPRREPGRLARQQAVVVMPDPQHVREDGARLRLQPGWRVAQTEADGDRRAIARAVHEEARRVLLAAVRAQADAVAVHLEIADVHPLAVDGAVAYRHVEHV